MNYRSSRILSQARKTSTFKQLLTTKTITKHTNKQLYSTNSPSTSFKPTHLTKSTSKSSHYSQLSSSQTSQRYPTISALSAVHSLIDFSAGVSNANRRNYGIDGLEMSLSRRYFSQTPDNKETSGDESAEKDGTNNGEVGEKSESSEEDDDLKNKITDDENTAKITDLELKLKESKEQMMRIMADTENMRKRSKKEMDDAKIYAIQSFAKQLLDVSDNLKRAIESVPKEEIDSTSTENSSLLSLYEGVEMTKKELEKVFSKNKVVEYGEIGDKFDPHLHNAMFNIPDPDKEKGTIGQVIKTGFKFHDRVLRPADVGTVQ